MRRARRVGRGGLAFGGGILWGILRLAAEAEGVVSAWERWGTDWWPFVLDWGWIALVVFGVGLWVSSVPWTLAWPPWRVNEERKRQKLRALYTTHASIAIGSLEQLYQENVIPGILKHADKRVSGVYEYSIDGAKLDPTNGTTGLAGALWGMVVGPMSYHRGVLARTFDNAALSTKKIEQEFANVYHFYHRANIWLFLVIGFLGIPTSGTEISAFRNRDADFRKAFMALAKRSEFDVLGEIPETIGPEQQMVIDRWGVILN